MPKSLRVIGWLSLVLGAWSLWDELVRVLDGRGMRMGYDALAIMDHATRSNGGSAIDVLGGTAHRPPPHRVRATEKVLRVLPRG